VRRRPFRAESSRRLESEKRNGVSGTVSPPGMGIAWDSAARSGIRWFVGLSHARRVIGTISRLSAFSSRPARRCHTPPRWATGPARPLPAGTHGALPSGRASNRRARGTRDEHFVPHAERGDTTTALADGPRQVAEPLEIPGVKPGEFAKLRPYENRLIGAIRQVIPKATNVLTRGIAANNWASGFGRKGSPTRLQDRMSASILAQCESKKCAEIYQKCAGPLSA
jgi:hypothetical protein